MNSSTNSERLVVTLATIPSRISRIAPVLESLKGQTLKPDQIYVCICEICRRDQSTYDVPDWLANDEAVDLIVSKTDYGPANKLLVMLAHETDPDTRIVIVDDDFEYSPNLLEVLVTKSREYEGSAVGLSGAKLTRNWSVMEGRIGAEIHARPHLPHQLVFIAESPSDVPVDILQGGFGISIRRGWIGDDIFELIDPGAPLFFADDVLFSGYLESKGIPRVCVSGVRIGRVLDQSEDTALHGDGRATRNSQAAIPPLAARLSIWAPESLYVPKAPFHSILAHRFRRLGAGIYRRTVKPLARLISASADRAGN